VKKLRQPLSCAVVSLTLTTRGGEWQNQQDLKNLPLNEHLVQRRRNRDPQPIQWNLTGQDAPAQTMSANQVTALRVRSSVERAVAYLQNLQQEDGRIPSAPTHHQEGSGTVMGALAMLAAGADPESDVHVRRALEWLSRHDLDSTYYRAVRANVWEYALRRSPENATYHAALKRDFEWLMGALGKKEGWRYRFSSSDWDNSVTQYGVLGVWAARRAGMDPGTEFWNRMSKHFLNVQNPDGGWGYRTGGSSANMATAGLATMFLVFDHLHAKQYYQQTKGNPFAEGAAAECLESIARGMTWLNGTRGNGRDGYYLYGIERTGVASGRKTIGGTDWFLDGVQTVLAMQQADGSIPLQGHGGPVVNTAFATLFMVYGGAPVAFNKLEYGEGQGWNLNPRDIANVTKHLWSAYERPLNWFSVHIDSPVEEFEAPILYLSGADKVTFTEEQILTLRQYLDRGGFIFAEASDGSQAFRDSMKKLASDLIPDADLTPLPADHDLYTVLKQDWKEPPALQGATLGPRLAFLLSEDYLAKDWQMNHTHTDAFSLMLNILFYATDRGSLYGRFHDPRPDKAVVADLPVLEVQMMEDRSEAAGGFVESFAADQIRIREQKEASVALLSLDWVPDQLDVMKQVVESGGVVIVDVWGGDPDVGDAVRNMITSTIGELEGVPRDHPLVVGRFPGGENLNSGIRFTLPARRELRSKELETGTHHLEAVWVGDRPAVIFSPYGMFGPAMGCRDFGAAAYRKRSAEMVLGNLFGYLSHTGM